MKVKIIINNIEKKVRKKSNRYKAENVKLKRKIIKLKNRFNEIVDFNEIDGSMRSPIPSSYATATEASNARSPMPKNIGQRRISQWIREVQQLRKRLQNGQQQLSSTRASQMNCSTTDCDISSIQNANSVFSSGEISSDRSLFHRNLFATPLGSTPLPASVGIGCESSAYETAQCSLDQVQLNVINNGSVCAQNTSNHSTYDVPRNTNPSQSIPMDLDIDPLSSMSQRNLGLSWIFCESTHSGTSNGSLVNAYQNDTSSSGDSYVLRSFELPSLSPTFPTSLQSQSSISISALFSGNEVETVSRSANSCEVSMETENSHESLGESSQPSWTKMFNTRYMKGVVDDVGKRSARDFSISAYLLNNVTNNACACCLCELHRKTGNDFEFCIRKHPEHDRCTNNQESKQVYICDECLSSMILNSKRNERTNQYQCDFDGCTKEVETVSSLKSHYFKHLNVKNFICDFCDNEYSTRAGLQNHERKHAQ